MAGRQMGIGSQKCVVLSPLKISLIFLGMGQSRNVYFRKHILINIRTCSIKMGSHTFSVQPPFHTYSNPTLMAIPVKGVS